MTDVAFDPRNPDTWLPMLTIDQVAAIYQRTKVAIQKALYAGKFYPRPAYRRPALWRKVEIVRDIEGARGTLRRTA